MSSLKNQESNLIKKIVEFQAARIMMALIICNIIYVKSAVNLEL